MRSLTILSLSVFIIFGCKKDNPTEPQNGCNEYEKTNENFEFVVITPDLNTSMYEKLLPGGSHIDREIDINCDGVADFKIKAISDVFYGDTQVRRARVIFKCSRPNLYVLTHQHNDSVYISNTLDTLGMSIYSNTTVSSNYFAGSTLDQVNSGTYVQGVNLGDTVFANSPDWKIGEFKMIEHYNEQTSGDQTDGNGYTMYYEYERDTYYGTIQNNQYIAIKYVSGSVVKLGYIAFNATAYSGFVGFGYNFIRMHS